ncbi:NAD(P)-dependent alcohol dehydrogenase [Devosia sp.]|uniref:NAD(P)-dependent alcohol dehydrogenase n=1 Tax=Devosia sp. TaxID=1871048 RepID=UPI003A8DDE00
MRAAVYERFGGPEVVSVKEVATPEPGGGEVRVRVMATTVSAADHRMRAKDLPRGLGLLASFVMGGKAPRKPILGMDFAGVIDKLGDGVSGWSVGQRVAGLTAAAFGGHGEYVCLKADGPMVPLPDTISFTDGVSVVFGGHTVSACLKAVTITPGDKVLVNGAAGAVGTMAVQIAAQMGAEVTAVTSARNSELARDLGASQVIDYAVTDFAGGEAVYDVIFECVGNAPYSRVKRVLKPGGTLLLVIADLPQMLSASWQGASSGHKVKVISGAPGAADVALEIDLLAQGKIRPVIDTVLPLDEIGAAHRLVDTGRKRGAVVVTLD